jgi:hypothetical protein
MTMGFRVNGMYAEARYAVAAKAAAATTEPVKATWENGCVATACCLCWQDVKVGDLVVPVYGDIYRPAHVSCINNIVEVEG